MVLSLFPSNSLGQGAIEGQVTKSICCPPVRLVTSHYPGDKEKGQGAMEYLMTYGWAILIIMIVGVAMWQLGMFNMGGAAVPTSSGFEQLRPLLATCQISNATYWSTGVSGFSCQFTNNAGTNVRLGFLNATVNGNYCPWVQMSERFVARDLDFEVYCQDNPDCPNPHYFLNDNNFVFPLGIIGSCNNAFNPPCLMDMPADSTLMVSVISSNQPIFGGNTWGPCNNTINGQPYDIFIDIGYLVEIGGVTSQKHSTGTIHLTASTK
jgi:hypothetical protein